MVLHVHLVVTIKRAKIITQMNKNSTIINKKNNVHINRKIRLDLLGIFFLLAKL